MTKFSDDNILQYLHELIGITNKRTIQWYEFWRDICTVNAQKDRRQKGDLGQEIWNTDQVGRVPFNTKVTQQTDPLSLNLNGQIFPKTLFIF